MGAGFNWGGALGSAAIGGGMGALLGSQMGGGQYGALGGGLGGALGAGAGFALTPYLGPAAPIIGGLLGSVGGSLLGGLFGGGGDSDKIAGTVQGGFGAAGGGVLGDAIKEFDRGVVQLLNTRQREAVDEALRRAAGTRFSFKGELDQGTLEHVTGERARDIARTLGFRTQAIAPGAVSPQQAVQNLQTAIQTKKAIAELTNQATEFSQQIEPGFPGWAANSLTQQADSGRFPKEIEPAERAWDGGRDG